MTEGIDTVLWKLIVILRILGLPRVPLTATTDLNHNAALNLCKL